MQRQVDRRGGRPREKGGSVPMSEAPNKAV